MLTGTRIDLSPFGSILQGAGILYWGLCATLVVLALWLPRSWWVKLPLALALVALFVVPVVNFVNKSEALRASAQARFDASNALFKQHCKTAGEKIHKTVDNVDGVVWMKWRPTSTDPYDQFALDDPFGQDCSGDDCILQLLRVTKDVEKNPEDAHRHRGRYDFVESIDPADGLRYRYTAAMKLRANWTEEDVAERAKAGNPVKPHVYGAGLARTGIDRFTARYGITWDDLSTREDREHWIAGGSLKVIDLQTQEVIAERIGYMMDAEPGNTDGGRSPWGHANYSACPAKRDANGKETRIGFTNRFVESVLSPSTGVLK